MLWFFGVLVILVLISLKQIYQYERGVLYTMGRFVGVLSPGWRIVIPIFQSMVKVDIRTKAVDVPKQETITKDNVSCKTNAVIYYKVNDPAKSVNEVEHVYWAVSQLSQTTMRRVIGEVTLDELLAQREEIADRILKSVDVATDEWGVVIEAVELKDIELPESMVRTMARQAEADREKRAKVISSEGEKLAAENLMQAAELLGHAPGALHLRTLNSINEVAADKSNTVVFALPIELLRAIEGMGKGVEK
ncbi:MAG: slipin family protein [Patescibacteria group bacterium]